MKDREALILGRARAGLGPGEPRRQLVLRRLSAKLAGAPLVGHVAPPDALDSKPPSPAAAPSASSGFSLQTLVVGVLAGAVAGFGVGAAVTPAGSPAPPAPSSGVSSSSRAELESAPRASIEPVVVADMTEPPRAAASAKVTPSRPNLTRRAAANGPVEESPSAVEPTFYEELSYVRRAQSALQRGDGRVALGLMQSLDEIKPSGALLAERNVTRVLALCQLGLVEEAAQVARRTLANDETANVYRQRLADSCAGPGLAQETTPKEKPVKHSDE